MSKAKPEEGPARTGSRREIEHRRSAGPSARAADIEKLLAGLDDIPPADLWKQFLECHAWAVMKVAQFHAPAEDLAQDCFLYICEKLAVDGFRKLKKFDPARAVPFDSWLTVVVSNLARDWRRQEFGRRRLPTAVRAMSELDQAVYRLKYFRQLEASVCLKSLRERFPNITRTQLTESLSRLHDAFSPEERWRLSFANQAPEHRHVSYESGFITNPFTSGTRGPDEEAVRSERAQCLREILATFPVRQRLLLRLRFEQQLSLREAARIAGCTNLHQARRLIQKALDELRPLLAEN